jgi:signal transduction histidine kinase
MVILAHLAYASVAYALALRPGITPAAHALNYYVDAGAFVLLIAFTGATDDPISYLSILLFLFAAMTASLGWGVNAGLRLTIMTAALSAVAMLARARLSSFEGSHAFLHISYITCLGVVTARWSGHDFTLRRRLALLRDAQTLSNPRFGVDHTIGSLLGRLREFYDAEVCLLIERNVDEDGWRMRRCDRVRSPAGIYEEVLPADLADALLWVPQNALTVYVRRPLFNRWLAPVRFWAEEVRKDAGSTDLQAQYRPDAIESLLSRLGGWAWLSVPVYSAQQWRGRLHLVARRALGPSDARFVAQAIGNSMLVVENIRLLDQLASSAAQHERLRLARDLHDGVIQPYVGVQLGLVAVDRALRSGHASRARDEVRRLLSRTTETIDELRASVGGLQSEARVNGNGLVRALEGHAARFSEETAIEVEVSCDAALRLGDRLGVELFQMVVEALSNVRRHTTSTRAAIYLVADKDYVRLQVENHEPAGGRSKPFTPRSIYERASALGGRVTVDRRRDGRTVVEIEIPL